MGRSEGDQLHGLGGERVGLLVEGYLFQIRFGHCFVKTSAASSFFFFVLLFLFFLVSLQGL